MSEIVTHVYAICTKRHLFEMPEHREVCGEKREHENHPQPAEEVGP